MRLSLLLAVAERAAPPWAPRMGRAAAGKRGRAGPPREGERMVFRGDTVQVLSGSDAGKQGRVVRLDEESRSVRLDRLNLEYRYVESAEQGRVLVASEKPLPLKDVALVDPADRLPTQVVWRYTEQGERVRVSVRTGRIIPKPIEQREDGIVPEQWVDGPKDTSTKDALQKTYTPSLKTFQEEVMELMGIAETRRARRSYWY